MRVPLLIACCAVGCSEWNLKEVDPDPDVADLLVDPGFIDYGIVPNGTVESEVITLSSVGNVPVTVKSVRFDGSDAFTVTLPEDDLVLDPGESIDLVVDYSPVSYEDSAEITVRSDGQEPKQTVGLLGAGVYAALVADPSPDVLYSTLGETVSDEVTITSIGTTDLVIYEMVVQGEWFNATADLPVTLAPGESTTIEVTYTPETEGETVEGKLWMRTSTTTGDAVVPLIGQEAPACMGPGEAWDRGLMTGEIAMGTSLRVSNLSEDQDICIDQWYVWLSETSQDLGAGDMNGDAGDDYPYGSITLGAGEHVAFKAEGDEGEVWYCLEQTQYTSRGSDYTWLGARVPEPLLSYMRNGDQDGSWAWQLDNPVMMAGRETNLVDLGLSGGDATVTLRIINMGGKDGYAEVREAVPAGYSASGFSQEPVRTETGSDGGAVYVFEVALDAREETDLHTDTDYDEVSISYTLTVPPCEGRTYAAPMETRWEDSDGEIRTDTANPLAIVCD